MTYNPESMWTRELTRAPGPTETFPAQGLIRVLRGTYPRLPVLTKTGAAVDVGCGDGRNAAFLRDEGFEATGIEISQEIVKCLERARPGIRFMVGRCHDIPVEDRAFNLTVSWNACYYMGLHDGPFEDHLAELARVTSPGGAMVLSIPMPTNFIFQNSLPGSPRRDSSRGVNYRVIKEDPFGIRNGETLASVEDETALLQMVRRGVKGNVVIGTEVGDWFGLAYNWWVVVAIR